MIFNIIKKLYFARVDEAKVRGGRLNERGSGWGIGAGVKALSKKQEGVKDAAIAAIQGIQAPEDSPATLGLTGKLTGFVRRSADNNPEYDLRFLSHPGFTVDPMQVMSGSTWENSRNNDIRNGSNPAWIIILNDFLGAEAEDDDGNTDTTQQELDAAGINTKAVKPQDENHIAIAGNYLGAAQKPDGTPVVEDPQILAAITVGIKSIVRNLQTRSAMVRSEKHARTDAWAVDKGFAGMRGAGSSKVSWEFTLAHAQGVFWPTDEFGKRLPGEAGRPVKKPVNESDLLKATESKVFFEKLAAGKLGIKDCQDLKNKVEISEGKTTRISYFSDNEGIVKNALAPELDAIRRIKERCACKGEEEDEEGCIEKGKNPFGILSKYKYSPQVINDYVGKMVETLRVAGLLSRMKNKLKDGDPNKSVLDDYIRSIAESAVSEDTILHQLGLERLQNFEITGTDIESYEDIDTLEELEELTGGDRWNLYKIIQKLEAKDLRARDPDIVLPIGLTVGDGDRKDNMEAHLTEEDAIAAMLNQGVGRGLSKKKAQAKAKALIKERTLDELELMGAPASITDIYKDIHSIKGDTPIYCMGLSLKNQMHDSSTKFGEESRTAQSDQIRSPDEALTPKQLAFRKKCYETLGIKTEAARIEIREKQREHDKIKDDVYGLFPSTEWFMTSRDGKSKKYTSSLIARRFIDKIKAEFPRKKLDGKDNELRKELVELLDKSDPKTEIGIGKIREKLTRIFTAHKTHKECNEVHLEGENKGELTSEAILARKHLAATVFFTGGSVDEILASKRGLKTGSVSIYSQNDALVPALKGIIEGGWSVQASTRGDGLTTLLVDPTDSSRYVGFGREGQGKGYNRQTRFTVDINKNYLKKHLLEMIKSLFEDSTLEVLYHLMNTQQKLFEKLLIQVG